MKAAGSLGTTVPKAIAAAQCEQHPTSRSPIGQELLLAGPQHQYISHCRLNGLKPRGFTAGAGWLLVL